MKLVKITPYARQTPETEKLFLRAVKTEAKWNKLVNKIGTKGDLPPTVPLRRLAHRAASIQKKLNKLGFGIKD